MTAVRLCTAIGICGGASAAGAGDWTTFCAFAVPAIGFALLWATARPVRP